MKLSCVIALLIGFGSAALAAEPQELIFYTEPPATYLNALEVVSVASSNVAFTTVVLTNGQREEIPRGGIVAIVALPPRPPSIASATEANDAIRKIRSLEVSCPQYQGKLASVLAAWNAAIAYSHEHNLGDATLRKSTKSGPDLQVDGITYHDVALLSFNGKEVGISHADGAATIPAPKLTSAQIAALNATTTTVRITASKIRPLHAKAESDTPNPQSPVPGSTVDTAADDREVARLKGAVIAAEENLQKLQAEQAALKIKINATPNSLRSSPEFQAATRRDNALHAEIQQAQVARGDATENLRKGERAILSKTLNATVEAYRTAATLPSAASDWPALQKKWSGEVTERTQSASAADDAAKKANSTAWNTPEATRLNQISDAEEKKLQIARTTLQTIQTRIVEADRQTQEQKQQTALDQQQSAEQAKIEEHVKQFRALPAVTDTFVEPKLPTDDDSPTFAETMDFISAHIDHPKSEIGFGEHLQNVIYRDESRVLVFNPGDLNLDVKYTKGGGSNSGNAIRLECRNNKPLIQVWYRWQPQLQKASWFTIPTGDDIDTEKMAKAFSHLILMFGGKKEAF